MRLFLPILFIQFTASAQVPDLTLPDTIITRSLELFLASPSEFKKQYDTLLLDERLFLVEDKNGWASPIYYVADTNNLMELFLITDPETNTSIDSVKYLDFSGDGADDALLYYSRTDGYSGESGGFSDYGKGVILLDQKKEEVIFEFEYYTIFESRSQELIGDEYVVHETSCEGYTAYFLCCDKKLYISVRDKDCGKPIDSKANASSYYYELEELELVKKKLKVQPPALCP